MDPETVILSEVSQTGGEILYDIAYMWNPKRNDTNERVYKTVTDSQRTSLWLPGGRTEGKG